MSRTDAQKPRYYIAKMGQGEPSSSWWTTVTDRAAFSARVAQEVPRMSVSKFGTALKVTEMEDAR